MAPVARAIRRKPRPGAPGFGLARSIPGTTTSASTAMIAAWAMPFARNRECIATSLECDRAAGPRRRSATDAGSPIGSEGDLETEPDAARSPIEVVQTSPDEVLGIRRPALLGQGEDAVTVAEPLLGLDDVRAVDRVRLPVLG